MDVTVRGATSGEESDNTVAKRRNGATSAKLMSPLSMLQPPRNSNADADHFPVSLPLSRFLPPFDLPAFSSALTFSLLFITRFVLLNNSFVLLLACARAHVSVNLFNYRLRDRLSLANSGACTSKTSTPTSAKIFSNKLTIETGRYTSLEFY